GHMWREPVDEDDGGAGAREIEQPPEGFVRHVVGGRYHDGAVVTRRDASLEQPVRYIVEAIAPLPQQPGDRTDGFVVQPTRVLHLEVRPPAGGAVPVGVTRPVVE